jgi:hypothetical protein
MDILFLTFSSSTMSRIVCTLEGVCGCETGNIPTFGQKWNLVSTLQILLKINTSWINVVDVRRGWACWQAKPGEWLFLCSTGHTLYACIVHTLMKRANTRLTRTIEDRSVLDTLNILDTDRNITVSFLLPIGALQHGQYTVLNSILYYIFEEVRFIYYSTSSDL